MQTFGASVILKQTDLADSSLEFYLGLTKNQRARQMG